MDFFVQLLRINFKKTLTKATILFIASFVGVFMLITAVSFYKPQKVVVSIVLEDESTMTESIAKELCNNEEIASKLEIEFVKNEKDALGKAVIILPMGFMESIMNGDNLSPRVLVRGLTSIESAYLKSVAVAMESYLLESQSAIYSSIDMLREKGVSENTLRMKVLGINAIFVKQFAERMKMIDGSTSSFDSLQLILSLLLSFCFMLAFLSERSTSDCVKFGFMLRTNGKTANNLLLIDLICNLVLFAGVLLPFLVFRTDIDLFAVSICFSIITILIKLLSNSVGESVFYAILFLSISLFLSGNLIPLSLLPSWVSRISILSPLIFIGKNKEKMSVEWVCLILATFLIITFLWRKKAENEEFCEHMDY